MLCAADELGLSSDHSGLLLLDAAQPAGRPLAEVLPPPETLFDLEITWNRPDCLSIIGIAREFAALLRRPVRLPEVAFPESGEPVERSASVRIDDPAACPRYTARVLRGIRDGASPAWMARRLERCGVRPISLIVDVTNYVMLECGQPLHAFDYNRVTDHTIIVRRARPGEIMTTLDEVARVLDEETLVIADPARAVAVAGVMGGAGSEIAPGSTDTVLLESALFEPAGVKRTATRLALRTESSHRFERGVDTDLADWASRRAAALLAAHGGAVAAPGVIDQDHRKSGRGEVALRFRRVREVMGVELPSDEIAAMLQALGFEQVRQDETQAVWRVPSWRLDVELEADLIEEVARLHGLAAIPDLPPRNVVVPRSDDAEVRARALCRRTLMGFGFTEAMHYSFLSAAELDLFDKRRPEWRVALPNPVSADYAILRDSLLPQMVLSLGRNVSRQVEAPALFEIGRVFYRDGRAEPCEETRLSIGFCGPFGRPALDRRRPVAHEEAALWLKGAIEALAAVLHAGEVTLRPADHPAMDSGWGTELLLDGAVVGRLGLIANAIRHHWRLNAPMAVAEVRLDALLAHAERREPPRPTPAFPAVRRDVAFVAPGTIRHADVVAVVRAAAPAELTRVELFDIFTSKEIERGRRSMGYTLEFQSPERTLTDDEVNEAFARIVAALQRELHVDVRAG
jgi:phenylalanyl-tRNA synthetase beta chain